MSDGPSVGIYWDFENLHAALVDRDYGDGVYRRMRYQRQNAVIDIPAMMDFAASLGPIAVNRAYAHWAGFRCYQDALLEHAFDLVQLFPTGPHGKNGADIRLALDLADDLSRYPHLGTVILVSGDSDFIAVAQLCRRLGRDIVGVGASGSVNHYWTRVCTRFVLYQELSTEVPGGAGPVLPPQGDDTTADGVDTELADPAETVEPAEGRGEVPAVRGPSVEDLAFLSPVQRRSRLAEALVAVMEAAPPNQRTLDVMLLQHVRTDDAELGLLEIGRLRRLLSRAGLLLVEAGRPLLRPDVGALAIQARLEEELAWAARRAP